MQERFKDMHQRLDNAYASLVEMIKVNSSSLPEVDGKFVRSILPMSTDEATKVAEYYIKHKIARLRVNDGGVTIKHGVFLERDVLGRALEQANTQIQETENNKIQTLHLRQSAWHRSALQSHGRTDQ